MKTLLLASLLVLTACETTSYDAKEVFTVVEFAKEQTEDYNVRMDFVFFRSEVHQYPLAAKAMINAITIWSSYVPVEMHVTLEDDGLFPWLTMGPNLSSTDPSVIKVHFDQLDDKVWGGHPNLAGAWLAGGRTLYIDAADVNDMGHLNHIALHELGHALGLTHVIPMGGVGIGISGDISVHGAAETYLMFPALSENNLDAMPSEIEIEIAHQYVTGIMLHPGVGIGVDYFCLTDD